MERHPVIGFFLDDRLTDWRINGGLTVLAPLVLLGGIVEGPPVVIGVALVMLLILWRNWVRFRMRLADELAERDRTQRAAGDASGRPADL